MKIPQNQHKFYLNSNIEIHKQKLKKLKMNKKRDLNSNIEIHKLKAASTSFFTKIFKF